MSGKTTLQCKIETEILPFLCFWGGVRAGFWVDRRNVMLAERCNVESKLSELMPDYDSNI